MTSVRLLLTSAQRVVKTKELCNRQELREYNSLCEYIFFFCGERIAKHIGWESTQALQRDVVPRRSADSLKGSTRIWMRMIQPV